MKSSQGAMKEVMIVLTMIGFDNGIMILEKTSHFVAPSTIAASSSARNRIKEALGYVKAQPRTAGIYHNQRQEDHGTLGQSKAL